jgi:hypothetical protein
LGTGRLIDEGNAQRTSRDSSSNRCASSRVTARIVRVS